AADFSADPSINAMGIYKEAAASLKSEKSIVASYPASRGASDNVHIQGHWLNFTDVSVYHFLADMDVDCDDVYVRNDDGQNEINFGAFDARYVPWHVLSNKFYNGHKNIEPNAGDSNGAKPKVTGEASLLLADTCFPKDGMNGKKGHEPLDVLYMVFQTKFPAGVGENTMDINTLKKLGDEQAQLLANALELDGGDDGGGGASCVMSGGVLIILHRHVDCSGSQVCCIFGEVNLGTFISRNR
ncbi:hypothetical protein EDD18DRAFT_1079963, partial [Armillaria luteobubalina]